MARLISILFGLTCVSACQSTTISSDDIVASSGVTEFEITTPLLDTPPLTTELDVDFASLLNGLRIDNGLTSVTYDERLDQAAQKHADDMVENGYFSHFSQDGSTFSDRIAAEGYVAAYAGENIAARQQTNEDVLATWLQSDSGHRELMLDESLPDQTAEHFALGVSGEGIDTKWVLLMAREQ
jgi:uncharacterized protein YkwD